MKHISNIYLKNSTAPMYRHPEGHNCHNCPYALQTDVPGCMFPSSGDECFRYRKQDPREQEKRKAAQKIKDFIQALERVKERKGYTNWRCDYEKQN